MELRPVVDPLSIPQVIRVNMEHRGENRRTRKETFPSATLPTVSSTFISLRTNPGLRVKKPPTYRLSYGKASVMHTVTTVL